MNLNFNSFKTVFWQNDAVILLDQRLLPGTEQYNRYSDVSNLAQAISTMVVRGAPAIGITAAYGVVLAIKQSKGDIDKIKQSIEVLLNTRPTAVNLAWALSRMWKKIEEKGPDFDILLKEADSILNEDIAACKKMGDFGASKLCDGANVLTHCNAGALATGGWGTALGVIRSAVAQGKNIFVFADETRPRLQGAKLTAWELLRDEIPVTLIPDNAAASLLASKKIDAVIVGADRIAANGDVCNKVGTYSVALAARQAGVPFYVAAPKSTIDMDCLCGDNIPIEQREEEEVTIIDTVRIAPQKVKVFNPAFDVTPSEFVTAIFTEDGIIEGDYINGLKNLFC